MRQASRFGNPVLKYVRAMTTIASLGRVSAKSLSERILEEQDAKDPTYAIVDVRDDGKTWRLPGICPV